MNVLDPVFTFEGGKGRLFLRFEKVNQAKRMVWGIAQVQDDPDCQGDVVDFDASVKAFQNWAGNIREMHTAKAVGRCVKIVADKVKKRIYVGVHVSAGAEDTWQKVLDGTLRGFSIGGSVVRAVKQVSKATGKAFRLIKEYVLDELSLVDSPANAHCLITAVQKRGNTLVPIAEVLGIVPAEERKPMKRTRIATLHDIAKAAAAAGDSLVVIKRSDLAYLDPKHTKTDDPETRLVIKATAPSAVIAKDEFQADGYGNEDPGAAGGPGVEDEGGAGFEPEPHLTNLAKCHNSFAKAAGIDPDAHYAMATQEADPTAAAGAGAAGMAGAGAAGGDPNAIAAGRGLLTRAQADAIVKAAVTAAVTVATKDLTDQVTALSKMIDDKSGGGAPVVRKGGSSAIGELVQKGGAGATTEVTDDITKALKACQTLVTERDDLLAKRQSGVTLASQEMIRTGKVSEELSKAIEHFAGLVGRTPTTEELKGGALAA